MPISHPTVLKLLLNFVFGFLSMYSHFFTLFSTAQFIDPFRSTDYEDCWYRMMHLNFENKNNTSFFSSVNGVDVFPVEYMGRGPGGGTLGCDYLLVINKK